MLERALIGAPIPVWRIQATVRRDGRETAYGSGRPLVVGGPRVRDGLTSGTRFLVGAAVLLAAAAVAGLGSVLGADGATGSRISWSAQSSPFALTVLNGRTSLFADATGPAGPGSRLSYALADGSQHTLTSLLDSRQVVNGTVYRVATNEPGRTSTVTVTRAARGLHISWRLLPATGVATVYSALRSPAPLEHFVGGGINQRGVDLNGELVQLKVAYSCRRSVVTPFFASTGGYGVYFDTDSVGQIQFRGSHDGMTCNDSNSRNPLCKAVSAPDRVQVCFKASSLDYDVFAGTPAQVVAAYRLTVGRMPIPSHAEFALIKWRDTSADLTRSWTTSHSYAAWGSRSGRCSSTTRGRPTSVWEPCGSTPAASRIPPP